MRTAEKTTISPRPRSSPLRVALLEAPQRPALAGRAVPPDHLLLSPIDPVAKTHGPVTVGSHFLLLQGGGSLPSRRRLVPSA